MQTTDTTPTPSARVTITGRLLHEARDRAFSDPTLTLSQATAAEYEFVIDRIRDAGDLHRRIRSELPEELRPLSDGGLPWRVAELANRAASFKREADTWRRGFIACAIVTLVISALALLP